MSRDNATLQDILDAARNAQAFLGSLDAANLARDAKTQAAIMYELMIVGEAVKRLSQELRDAHPEIDWKGYAGLRDVLIHSYDEINMPIVWNILQKDIPALIERVDPLIAPKDAAP